MTGVLGLAPHLALGILSAALLVACLLALVIRKPTGGQPKGKAAAASTSKATISTVMEHDPSKPLVRILYGTQTGTAERFSKQLGKELSQKYGEGTLIDIVDVENYKADLRMHKEKLVILCMATYGDGEPTDNAADFYTWLCQAGEDSANSDRLQGVTYAVFGLGNKQYEHFNKMGKQAFKYLGAMGAKPLIRRGDGDDDDSIDDDFEKWCAELHDALAGRDDLVGAQLDQDASKQALTPETVTAYDVLVMPAGAKAAPAFAAKGSGLDAHHPLTARISSVRELHSAGSDRSCVHVEVDLSGHGVKYQHGDHVAVHAQNSAAVVGEVVAMLGMDAEALITLRKPAKGAMGLHDPPCAGPVSLRTAVACFADVLASPHKDSLLALAAFAKDAKDAERLQKLATCKDEYAAYIGKVHRSLLEVMRDFPSARPSVGAFFGSVAPRLQPRFYSISSSPAQHPTSIHITAAVVRETMPTGRVHEGVASTWLKAGEAGTPVPIFVRHSHFKLPSDPAVPIVMVGPGTGLAPFRGFLQERAALQAAGKALGPAVLFFGCRNRAHDYIYRDELEGFLDRGVVSELHVAFSREGAQKDYVQHHIERHSKALWTLLADKGAYLYVCGDAKHMAKDVNRALLSLVQAGKGCSGTQAEAFVKQLQDAGRYQRDVW